MARSSVSNPGRISSTCGGVELQHPGDVVEEIPDRARQLRLGRDDLGRQRLSITQEGQFWLGHSYLFALAEQSKFNTSTQPE